MIEAATPDVGIFAHGFTYTGHPVGAAVAMANLDIIERNDLVGNAARVGPYFHERMRSAIGDHPHIGEIRGEGLIMAVEFVSDRDSKIPFDPKLAVHRMICAEAANQGLIVRALPSEGAALALSPPLCLSETEADRISEILVKAVDTVLARVNKG